MVPQRRTVLRTLPWIFILIVVAQSVHGASRLTLNNGMTFEGQFDRIPGLALNPLVNSAPAGGVDTRPVVIVDDGVRRTYFPFRQLAFAPTETGLDDTPIRIKQRVATKSPRVGSVGAILSATPVDQWGRRSITVMTSKGRQEIVLGITEISPVYTRLRGLQGERSVNWDMRIATSSIPSDTLRRILLRNDQKSGADARRDIVRLLFQSERYQEAARELESAMKEYPELEELKSLHQQLIQRGAQRLLREIELRQQAGQHAYVARLLAAFPSENVATTNLIRAAELLKEYEVSSQRRTKALDLLDPLVEQVEDPPRRQLIDMWHADIKRDLNINNLPRLADFLRLADDTSLSSEERLAIAVSGWLLGPGEGIRNLAVASSLIEVRNLTREYLRAMGADNRHIRKELLSRITEREGATPAYIAKLLKHIVPPHDTPEAHDIPGFIEVTVQGTEPGFPVRYRVQLPPAYDPYARYPAIVTLHAASSTPEAQINWWAGDYDEKLRVRRGQAMRHGYIVIAPEWTTEGQGSYGYSAREHNVVLKALRDALRKFSIDSDRVFLSGHALGGDAAWDIGLAHPDLWAGLMLIGPRADYGRKEPQYVTLYNDNAKMFPTYFVFGELDANKLADNSVPLNRYMKQAGFDPIVVQYQGRGNEHFYDEIQRLFQWMQLQTRDFSPQEFEAVTMRPWDNFFWYLELDGFPAASMVSPLGWSTKPRPSRIKASYANNRISVRTGAAHALIWLSPEIVDFEKRIEISINAKNHRSEIVPDVETMLEDARTRADRQHVFWTRIEVQTGRGGG